MQSWIEEYLKEQARVTLALPVTEIASWISLLVQARKRGAQVFACGNGGSSANCSHFAVDLGKGSATVGRAKTPPSDKKSLKRFRVWSLNDNIPWITALGNDYSYEDIFVEQLKNYGKKGDILIAVSVSGNSPNVVKAVKWANSAGLVTLALAGNNKNNQISRLAKKVIAIPDHHYGRVEDAQMHILHLLCYAFIESKV